MSEVLDEGLALFAGLNAIPKRSFLTEYSCRIGPAAYPELLRGWFDAVSAAGLERGHSFDLDFHTIPFHGEDALVQKHYVSKRSRRQKGILAFLAQDAATRVFCYANADLRADEDDDEILRFVEFWRKRTGRISSTPPPHSPSPRTPSTSDSRNAPTTPCSSPPGLTRPRSPYPGSAKNACVSTAPNPKMLANKTYMGIQASVVIQD
jgi:hypothetical protein